MQLEKERLELEKKREEERRQKMMEAQKIQQSSSIEVPKGQPVPQVTVEVPPKVLEVRLFSLAARTLITAFLLPRFSPSCSILLTSISSPSERTSSTSSLTLMV